MRKELHGIPAKLNGGQCPALSSHARGAWRPFNGASIRKGAAGLHEIPAYAGAMRGAAS